MGTVGFGFCCFGGIRSGGGCTCSTVNTLQLTELCSLRGLISWVCKLLIKLLIKKLDYKVLSVYCEGSDLGVL